MFYIHTYKYTCMLMLVQMRSIPGSRRHEDLILNALALEFAARRRSFCCQGIWDVCPSILHHDISHYFRLCYTAFYSIILYYITLYYIISPKELWRWRFRLWGLNRRSGFCFFPASCTCPKRLSGYLWVIPESKNFFHCLAGSAGATS